LPRWRYGQKLRVEERFKVTISPTLSGWVQARLRQLPLGHLPGASLFKRIQIH
jgi:hypothetical protein